MNQDIDNDPMLREPRTALADVLKGLTPLDQPQTAAEIDDAWQSRAEYQGPPHRIPKDAWEPQPDPAPTDPKVLETLTETLTQRGSKYGPFIGHAMVTQDLKNVIRAHLKERDKELNPDQQEALDMICHKIGRIINGDPDYDDSWIDIAGYAQLVADRLRGITR